MYKFIIIVLILASSVFAGRKDVDYTKVVEIELLYQEIMMVIVSANEADKGDLSNKARLKRAKNLADEMAARDIVLSVNRKYGVTNRELKRELSAIRKINAQVKGRNREVL